MKKKLIVVIVSMLAVLAISVGVFATYWGDAGFRTVKRYNTTTGYTFFVQRIAYGPSMWTLDIDGVWGSKTTEAVKVAQRKCGVTADGIVGPVSWGAFDSVLTQTVWDANGNECFYSMGEGCDAVFICYKTPTGKWYTQTGANNLFQFK